MKKILSLFLAILLLFTVLPMGALTVSAAVGDNDFTEIESNNSQSTADRIYNDYTVSARVYGSDMDYFKFTLSSTSKVTVTCISDYSCLLFGIFNSSNKALAAGTYEKYTSSGYAFYLSSTLSAGTYYLIFFNEDGKYYYNDYLFYFNYTSSAHTHSYSNSCDTTCNTCGATRSISHTYSNACDNTCNVCGETRSISHTYSNACDNTCNECGETRTVSGHTYTNNCSGPCSECGEIPDKATHTYDNKCDTTCNICGETRTVGDHKYTNDCDTACNYCKAERTVKHKYSNSCDTSCNICNKKRTVTHKYKTTTTKATTSKNGSVVKKCTLCSKVGSKTTIKYAKTFQLSATSFSYNGKVKTPSVTVKDSAGKTLKKNTDYTVTYSSGRKKVGTYKVTIKLKGKYSGSKTLSFTIKPAATKISKITAGKKLLKVNFTKKTSQTTGYQIQYATNKSFKSAKTKTISSNNTSSYTIKNLKTTNYYVRIRTYKVTNGKKYYSDWSSTKIKCPTHTHSYYKATCTRAKTCKICNATSGKALGHKKGNVNCSRCGKVLFTKLTYTGKGIKKISNINIPNGDFVMKLVATGTNDDVIDNCFVYLYNGGKSYTSAYAGVTVSVPVYGWSSSEEDPFEGPIKNGTIKVDAPNDIKWTITITPY